MENVEGNLLNLEKRDSKYKELPKEQRQGILEKLLQQIKENKLNHGAPNEVFSAFQITKNRISVRAVHCKNMIIDNVILAIKSKFPPAYKKKTIYVQQDNAKPHFSDNDADIVALASADDWNIKFKAQPANSFYLNVLDLGFFNSIQSLQYEASPHTIDELINCV
ncbi:hypothetical protein CWI36_1726p0010 [Hamiltosporidium magnivora]|uniref:Tc1-like transposase DDE domain-containing protein n=1 Tax=Hamiltosporidium magnivora TaxID=148818 RepID=A0A4Q9L0A6_9MICR|nr:hypothetical protein CWI36_1726p0010 [Hamiltosporidium magnivora]